MSYNFHIGQEVVALKNGDAIGLIKDNVYTVLASRYFACKKCKVIDVGLTTNLDIVCDCGGKQNCDGIAWVNAIHFAPLDSLTNTDELTEILSQPLFEVK